MSQNVFPSKHPLINHKLSLLRDKNTDPKLFRELVGEIAALLVYEATCDLPLKEIEVTTPLTTTKCQILQEKIGLVPILRAGLGMVEGVWKLLPQAEVWHIGLYRDENHRPVEYMVKLPDLDGRTFIVVDPMVATGYSGAHAVDVLKKRGVPGDSIRFMALVAAPEGVEVFSKLHPDVDLYVASLDDHLNENAYIVPGLGDAGDRIFGTK